jgi:hypothetical protein
MPLSIHFAAHICCPHHACLRAVRCRKLNNLTSCSYPVILFHALLQSNTTPTLMFDTWFGPLTYGQLQWSTRRITVTTVTIWLARCVWKYQSPEAFIQQLRQQLSTMEIRQTALWGRAELQLVTLMQLLTSHLHAAHSSGREPESNEGYAPSSADRLTAAAEVQAQISRHLDTWRAQAIASQQSTEHANRAAAQNHFWARSSPQVPVREAAFCITSPAAWHRNTGSYAHALPSRPAIPRTPAQLVQHASASAAAPQTSPALAVALGPGVPAGLVRVHTAHQRVFEHAQHPGNTHNGQAIGKLQPHAQCVDSIPEADSSLRGSRRQVPMDQPHGPQHAHVQLTTAHVGGRKRTAARFNSADTDQPGTPRTRKRAKALAAGQQM